MTKLDLKLKALIARNQVLGFQRIIEKKFIRRALLDGGSLLLSLIDFESYGQLTDDLK